MKPIDFRNATFEGLRGELEGMRDKVYRAWVEHGPGTTREISLKCGIDLLTFRPRTTELVELGLIQLVDSNRAGHEGIYRALLSDEWNQWIEVRRNGQLQLV